MKTYRECNSDCLVFWVVSVCGYCDGFGGGLLTIVVVENVGVADSDHALPAWGVGLSIGAVDEFAAAVCQIFAGLVDEWTADVLGASNANAVSGCC